MTDGVEGDGTPTVAGRRGRWLVLAAIGVLIVLVVGAVVTLTPLGPGPSLPAGATRLHIATEAPHLLPAMGCETAELAPVRVTSSGDDLVLVSVGTGGLVSVVWPSGWVAWRQGGSAELRARDGSLVAREGDVIADRFGGGVGVDDAFHVCVIGG